MRALLFALAVGLILGNGSALAKPPLAGIVYQFAGFTDDVSNASPDVIDGGQSMLEMNALCQDDYGSLARMCTEQEFYQSPNAEPPLSTSAWLHPTIVGDTTFLGVGASVDLKFFTCTAWGITDAGNSGLTVDTAGKLIALACNVDRPVTCCVPAE